MKKSTVITIAAMLTGSLLLGGCGKSAQENYADLCKKYEPYYAHTLNGKFYNGKGDMLYTEQIHSIIDKHKTHILEGEKIFKEMEKIASSDTEIMKHFQMTYLRANDTPTEAKRRFNLAVDSHKKYHSGCNYNFKF